MERLVGCSCGVAEANQALGWAWNAAFDQNVVGFDFTIVEETTSGRD
jgi:hypothetical protein